MEHIAVIGAGGFGISLAVMLHQEGHRVTMWSFSKDEVDMLNADREHKRLLPGILIPGDIKITAELSCVKDAQLVLLAVPSSAIRSVAVQLKEHIPSGAVVASVAKGLENSTLKRLSQVIAEELPSTPCVIVSGPSHAEEVSRGVPTTVVAASADRGAAEYVQDTLMNPRFRIYVNDDIIGVELGGALKNVIALAAGICDGFGLGDNTKAALMTRGITEIARLGVAMGAQTETFAGLSGVGDLIVTCTSMHSRNRRAGILIGEGLSAQEAIEKIGMTVEGYGAAKSAWALSQRMGVEMPITEQMYRVLYEGKSPEEAVRCLMTRPKRHESESIWPMD